MSVAFRHPATRAIGSAGARLLASFEGTDADDVLETYERFEDEALAADLAADLGVEFAPEDLL